jgi:hypothetical protein
VRERRGGGRKREAVSETGRTVGDVGEKRLLDDGLMGFSAGPINDEISGYVWF